MKSAQPFSRKIPRALAAATLAMAAAPALHAATVQTVFVIAMENHNWTQPNGNVGALTTIQQIKNNPNAPFINSLVNGTAAGISSQTAFTNTYYNVLANATGTTHIHPSEPSYIWSEAGTNFGVLNDNTPYGTNGTNQNTGQHLTGLLNAKGVSWKSYQEDIDTDAAGNVLPQNQWVSPITNRSGTYTTVANPYNASKQFDYAAKHNPMAFFSDTNGGNDTTPANPAAKWYAPHQQLATDLTNNAVAKYNWITPNQFNDMHTGLTGGYTPPGGGATLTGDSAKIRQGDDYLKQLVPTIMASQAYQNNGAIIIWNDETESQGTSADNADDFSHTSMEIVISPLAHANVGGLPYASDAVQYSHSSDLRTMQEIFGVATGSPTGFLGDAANMSDLSDLFAAGSIPGASAIPEPGVLSIAGMVGLTAMVRRRRR